MKKPTEHEASDGINSLCTILQVLAAGEFHHSLHFLQNDQPRIHVFSKRYWIKGESQYVKFGKIKIKAISRGASEPVKPERN